MTKSLKIRKKPVEMTVYLIVFFMFCVFAFSYIYMLLWCFYSGTRSADQVAVNPFGFSEIHLKNYIDVFTEMNANGANFVMLLTNSLYFSLFGAGLNILFTSMFAYVVSKYRFLGSKLIYMLVIVVITLPIFGTGSAMYRLLYRLGFLNSGLMLLTSLGGFSMNFLYMHAFFSSMSWSYAEAAEIDGANDWQIYFRIMFPQSITMVGSLFILMWMTEWNSYGSALIYLPKMPTLAVGIYQFRTQMMYESKMNILYAACAISVIPPLALFICCNNSLMSNVSLGGIKE